MADHAVSRDNESDRTNSPELDSIIGKRFDVLDDGFVRVVDYMGNDAAIVQAARVSYGSGTKLVRQDQGLIRYLLRHRHTTPFEMCEIKLHVRVPMDCWRQWVRHRTANINEYSTRYSEAIAAMQTTEPTAWRGQSSDNKQGSGAVLEGAAGALLTAREAELQGLARVVYDERLSAGVAREQARKDLPLSTYTEAYWKVDLHNLLHFLELRMDSAAQLEIRRYAETIGHEMVRRWCPLVWDAFLEYRIGAMTLSRSETAVIKCLAAGERMAAVDLALEQGLLHAGYADGKSTGGQREFAAKLIRLGYAPPWGA